MKLDYCPARGYCVEGSKKSCSSVRASDRPTVRLSVRPSRNRYRDHILERLWRYGEVWGSQNWPLPVLTGKWARFDNFWIIPDWRMLVTSGLFYAIVPSGATLALRVLSSTVESWTGNKNLTLTFAITFFLLDRLQWASDMFQRVYPPGCKPSGLWKNNHTAEIWSISSVDPPKIRGKSACARMRT